jgi:hypothetical protein
MKPGEIVKVKQRTGERGRPKEVTVLGSKDKDEIKILSQNKAAPEVEIYDRERSAEPERTVELGHVPTRVTEADKIRYKPRKPEEPEIRLNEADHKKWEKIKTLDEDDDVK